MNTVHASSRPSLTYCARTILDLLPGLILAACGAALSLFLDSLIHPIIGFSATLLIAVLVGILCGNFLPLSQRFSPGIAFSSMKLLRIGIVLLGLSVSLSTVVSLGWWTLLGCCAVVSCGFGATVLLGRRMGLSREQALLIGGGCSICGVAAIGAVQGVLTKKRQHEFLTAVAVVVVLGTCMIALAPLITRLIGYDDQSSAMFVGGSVQEVAQVVAAGGILGATILPIAVTVKLTRVVLLAPAMAILSLAERRAILAERAVSSDSEATAHTSAEQKKPPIIQLFVLGFIVALLVRTFIPLPSGVLSACDTVRTWFFAAAIFTQGLGVTVAVLRRTGLKPLGFGILVSCVVALVSALFAFIV